MAPGARRTAEPRRDDRIGGLWDRSDRCDRFDRIYRCDRRDWRGRVDRPDKCARSEVRLSGGVAAPHHLRLDVELA